jgi:hypothetical protein
MKGFTLFLLEKRPVGKPSTIWDDNINDLREVSCEVAGRLNYLEVGPAADLRITVLEVHIALSEC